MSEDAQDADEFVQPNNKKGLLQIEGEIPNDNQTNIWFPNRFGHVESCPSCGTVTTTRPEKSFDWPNNKIEYEHLIRIETASGGWDIDPYVNTIDEWTITIEIAGPPISRSVGHRVVIRKDSGEIVADKELFPGERLARSFTAEGVTIWGEEIDE